MLASTSSLQTAFDRSVTDRKMLLARHRTECSYRRGLALVLATMVAALTMVIVAPASATTNEKLMAWGWNEYGQLGNGTTGGISAVPVAVSKLSGVKAFAGGGAHSLALLDNGTVRAWGRNEYGQLGNGTTTNSNVPVAVKGLIGVTAIAAGRDFSLALLSNGTVRAWGLNEDGQLGNGTTTNSDVPVAVSGLSGITAISGNNGPGFALLDNGTVVAWGSNLSGELGDGTSSGPETCRGYHVFKDPCSTIPVAVSGLSGVKAVSSGGAHSLALLGDGTVMAWGENKSGQLGIGTSSGPESCFVGQACSTTPVAVSGLGGVAAISAGDYHSLALLSGGTVMAWGENSLGQLGDGGITGPELCSGEACSTTPVAVPGLSEVTSISAGLFHNLAYGTPPPTVTKLSPTTGAAAGGTTVTITGTSLAGATAVSFGSTGAASFTVNSSTSITAVSPAATAGTVDVTVTTPSGTSANSSQDHFRFGPPTVTEVSPNTGSKTGGTSVTVTGTGFGLGTGATVIKFGSTVATTVKCTSITTCTVVAPSHAVGTVDVKATVSGMSSVANAPVDQFTYN